MDKSHLPFLVTMLFSLVGVLGDFFLKLAGQTDKFIELKWFIPGLIIYASTAFGWFYVMRHMKLSTLSVVYSMCMILFLTALGVFYFKEKLSAYEIIGIGTAILSIVLLSRFG